MNNSYRPRRDATFVRTSRPSKPFNNAHSSGSSSRSSGHTGPRDSGTRTRSTSDRRHSDGGSFSRGGGHSRDGQSSARPGARRVFTHQRPQRSSGGGRGGRVQKTFDVSQFINRNPAPVTETEVFVPKHSFTEFGLDKKLAFTITSSGLINPTPIQDEIIPHILDGKDVIGLANTGTGKTAAFLIPLIDKTLREYSRQTLILTPTRELAIQIEVELNKISKGFKLYSTTCVGGTNIRPQIYGLKRKNHFIIGTPGRVMDLIDRGALRPAGITTVVLDEADRMLDMGFIHDMRKILSGIRQDRETLFFSATMSEDIKKLVNDFLNDPVVVSVKKQDITASILQDVLHYGHSNKFETLTTLLGNPEMKRVLIFGAMKHSVEKLSQQLVAHGITADSIHGNKSHPQRQRSLKKFKDGNARVLVATDVAARGIHVDNVTHVINYDLPATYEDYIHRIGRTGRGKEKGKAITFVQS
ncbi:MAG: DEAD/DEAH box helicase [Candidatus Pacebacteria bacterium]|nr:DEAD/DEAH box helicase [Candidatus Paceibacterota bacterium]MCF7857191.1 DEAD/DEAH box helicase [Candidatus Paceibacterota bacterium]